MTLLNDPKTFQNDHYINISVRIDRRVVYNVIFKKKITVLDTSRLPPTLFVPLFEFAKQDGSGSDSSSTSLAMG